MQMQTRFASEAAPTAETEWSNRLGTGWHCHTAGRRDILEEKQLYNSSPPEKIIHNMQRFSRYHCRGQTVLNTAKGFLVPPLWRIYSGCKCFVRIMNLRRHSAWAVIKHNGHTTMLSWSNWLHKLHTSDRQAPVWKAGRVKPISQRSFISATWGGTSSRDCLHSVNPYAVFGCCSHDPQNKCGLRMLLP